MSMTTKSLDAQTRPAAQPVRNPIDGAQDDPVAGFNPDVVVQQKDNAVSLKPSDSNWSHCDSLNGPAASVTPGKVVAPNVPDPGAPRTTGSPTDNFPDNF